MKRCKACGRRLWPWERCQGAGGEVVCETDVALWAKAKGAARQRERERMLARVVEILAAAYREPGPTRRKDEALKLLAAVYRLGATPPPLVLT